MTQILTCLTPEFVVLVADRRLVDLRTGDVVDDEAAKVVMLGSRAIISFTGLANVKPPPKGQTDLWIVDQLSPPPEKLPEIFEKLGEAANLAFGRITHLGPRAKKHSFVSVGWCEAKNDDQLEPFWLGISNAEKKTGKWREKAASTFDVSLQYLQDREWHLRVTGQPLPRHIDRTLRMQLVEQAPLTADQVVRLLTTAMRQAASVNSFIGGGMMAAVLPRSTVSSDRGFAMPAGKTGVIIGTERSEDPMKGPTCLYFPSDSNDGSFVAPHLITRNMVLADFQIHPRALTPEEIQLRYEEGLKQLT